MVEGKKEAELVREKRKAVALPKYYATVCEELSAKYSDYSKGFELHYGYSTRISIDNRSVDKYEIIRKIGRGRYADVYEGATTEEEQRVAIKILKPSIFSITKT